MFQKLFASIPRMTPQEFASQLLSICNDEEMNRYYVNLLNLSEPEKGRYYFTMFLFTALWPSTMAATSGKNHLLPYTGLVHVLMMNAWETKDKDSLVRLGDYIITDDEYHYLAEALGERWFQEGFCEARLMNRQIRFGTLLDKIGFIRGKQHIEDVVKEVEANPQGASADIADNLSMIHGLRLEEYIYAGSFGSTKEMSSSSTPAQWRDYMSERMKPIFVSGRSREEILSRAMMFRSLARDYLRRISNVYFTAIP